MQGYLALDLIRKNNTELVKGVERATTTTVSALRTAVIAALALGNQKLVLDQITALNTTTGNIIESTSVMLRQQTLQIGEQAANATVSIEKLQAAFNNIYATIDTILTASSSPHWTTCARRSILCQVKLLGLSSTSSALARPSWPRRVPTGWSTTSRCRRRPTQGA